MSKRKKEIFIVILMPLLAVALIAFPHGGRIPRIVIAAAFIWAAVRKIMDLWKEK